MDDRLRRLAYPAAVVILALTVVGGLLLGEPPERDRVEALGQQLRCPTCQSESVADSPSANARTMEARIAELVDEGASDEEILAHFVDRYGEWILLDPPMRPRNVALWALPLVAAVAGVVLIARLSRPASSPPELTEEQREQVRRALAEFEGDGEGGTP